MSLDVKPFIENKDNDRYVQLKRVVVINILSDNVSNEMIQSKEVLKGFQDKHIFT